MKKIATCRHVMPSGLRCQALAMRGSAFCYFHGRRIPPARKNTLSSEARIDVPAVLDGKGINYTLRQIMQGLGDGTISARRASILIYGLQMASANPSLSGSSPASLVPRDLFESAPTAEACVSLAESLISRSRQSANEPKG